MHTPQEEDGSEWTGGVWDGGQVLGAELTADRRAKGLIRISHVSRSCVNASITYRPAEELNDMKLMC